MLTIKIIQIYVVGATIASYRVLTAHLHLLLQTLIDYYMPLANPLSRLTLILAIQFVYVLQIFLLESSYFFVLFLIIAALFSLSLSYPLALP